MTHQSCAEPSSLLLKPCDRCGGAGQLLSLPAYVLAERICQCTLVYIQCDSCAQRISSDDVLGANPDITEVDKMLEVASVWNRQESRVGRAAAAVTRAMSNNSAGAASPPAVVN